MQLSILIPAHNHDALVLVRDLRALADSEGIDAEIIIGDDASTADMSWLYDAELLSGVRLWQTAENLGRARILNALACAARGEWLLIIDADAAFPAEGFSLKSYLEAGLQAPVVCGGLRHPEVNPCPEATLRYKYERQADRHRSAAERNRQPYMQLSTFNLMARRDVFLSVRFDERCTEYGYEDALFGADLEQRGIALLHIDNILLHTGLEPNKVYLKKAETALRTLSRLHGRMNGHSHVENVALSLRRWHVAWLIRAAYWLTRPLQRWNLLGKHPNLKVFAFYKLGYFLNLSPQS